MSGTHIGDPCSNDGTEIVGEIIEGIPPLHWSDDDDASYATVVTAGAPGDTIAVDHAYVTWPDLTGTDPVIVYDLQFRLRLKTMSLGGTHDTISILTMVSNPDEGGAWQLTPIPFVQIEFLDEIQEIVFSWREYLLSFSEEGDLPGLWPTVLSFYPEQVRSLSVTAEEVGDETDMFYMTVYEASLVVVTVAVDTEISAVLDLNRCRFT